MTSQMNSELERRCIDDMAKNGIEFHGSIISDGEIHRFSSAPNRRQKDEWYVAYSGISLRNNEYLCCIYGSWSDFGSTDGKYCFKSYDKDHRFDVIERKELQNEFKQKCAEQEKFRQEATEAAAIEASKIWGESADEASVAAHHRYCTLKKIKAVGVRFGNNPQGNPSMIIPLRNIQDDLRSLQFISVGNDDTVYKTFLGGAEKAGNFFVLGGLSEGTSIFVAEGYATACSIYEAMSTTVVVVAFDCHNLLPVVAKLRQQFPKKSITVCGDDDVETDGNPGRTKAEAAAGKYGCNVVFPSFPEELLSPGLIAPENSKSSSLTDFNDLHVLCGIAEVKQQLSAVPQAKERPKGFHFRPASQLIREPAKPNWLIKPYLDQGSFGELFGEPGSMKTFLALDMGLCVATGRPYHDLPVRQSGTVFYIAGEGLAGLSKRLHAWEIDSGIALDGVPFFVSDRPAQFLDENSAAEVSVAIDELRTEHGNPVFVIIDTLNRNFGPGDENVTSDMTKFVNSIDSTIRLRYGCAVLIVHHSPLNDSGRGRGASALRGALDWEYCITKVDNLRKLSNKKVKDHEPPPDIFFTPQTITLWDWIDEDDGEMMTSCVLKRTNGNAQKGDKRLTASQKIAYDCLVKLSAEIDDNLSKGVHIDSWRKATYEACISASSNPDTKKKAFQRAVKDLREKNCIEVVGDYYSLYGTRDKDGTFAGHVLD